MRLSFGSPGLFDETPATQACIQKNDLWYIRSRSPRLFGATLRAFMSHESVEDALIEVATRAGREGDSTLDDYSYPPLRKLATAARRVNKEMHLLLGFARFSLRADGLWSAALEPDNDILPALCRLFEARFGEERYVLVDLRRNYAILREGHDFQAKFHDEALALLPDGCDEEDAALFKRYFSAIDNPARKNSSLQRRLMPKRYWKHLVEL